MRHVAERRGRPYPWQVAHLLVWYVGAAAGLVVILVAWWGASGTTRLPTLITWVDVAVVGVVVSGMANLVWLLEGRRAVGERRYAVLGDPDLTAGAAQRTVADLGGELSLVAAEAMTRYHRAACPAVAGRHVAAASRDDHESVGRSPCGICRP